MILSVTTSQKTEFIDITTKIEQVIQESGITEGVCLLYVPHTTAGITINENADPTVKSDILKVLNQVIPEKADYKHAEGNSPAHIKSSLMGISQTIMIENGKLVLGTWQGIFFCEFDGPRTRKVYVRLLKGNLYG